VRGFLGDLITSGAASCAVALVGDADRVSWEVAAGEARVGVLAESATRFDYASLTKPFVATLALVLNASGELPLAMPISDVWPEADPRLARRPLSDLLRHRSGIAAWRPLYHLCRSRQDVLSLLLDPSLLGARAGTYSDLDYLLWGLTAERVTGEQLDALMRTRVLAPLGLSGVEPSSGDRPGVAQSFMATARESRLAEGLGLDVPPLSPPAVGLAQDGNARFLHGLGCRMSGHAGLFGGARDVWALAAEWLSPGKLLQPEAVAAALGGGGSFALGWWRRTLRGSAGRALSRSAFGHTGFAGNSLWIDPAAQRIFVLLTSRLDPSCDMNRWRRRFHALASTTIRWEEIP
jgi:serine-type D-Ala-D-Ala carboxypeptidase